MDIQQLQQSLKLKWLSYYEQNRTWLAKMRVWGTYEGLRRPSSGFILATLSVLEPEFDEILGFILDLNNNPDRIIAALGLNFNPDEELSSIKSEDSLAADQVQLESLQEERCEDKSVLSVAVTKVYQSPTQVLYSEHSQTEIERSNKPVVSFTSTTELVRTHQSPERIPNSNKLTVGLLRQKPVRSPQERFASGTTLAITTEVPVVAKTLPSLALNTVITSDRKISSLTFTRNNGNGKVRSLNIPKKADLSSSTNARSLASWVDEFCQGTGWNQEEAIAIPCDLREVRNLTDSPIASFQPKPVIS